MLPSGPGRMEGGGTDAARVGLTIYPPDRFSRFDFSGGEMTHFARGH